MAPHARRGTARRVPARPGSQLTAFDQGNIGEPTQGQVVENAATDDAAAYDDDAILTIHCVTHRASDDLGELAVYVEHAGKGKVLRLGAIDGATDRDSDELEYASSCVSASELLVEMPAACTGAASARVNV